MMLKVTEPLALKRSCPSLPVHTQMCLSQGRLKTFCHRSGPALTMGQIERKTTKTLKNKDFKPLRTARSKLFTTGVIIIYPDINISLIKMCNGKLMHREDREACVKVCKLIAA